MLGWTDVHDEVRVLMLVRLARVEATDRKFRRRDAERVVREKLGTCWRLVPEGQEHDIELMFEPKVAQNVAEVRWHESQQTTWLKDGRLLMKLRIDGLYEIAWWVCGYADQVRVLRPDLLHE